ncbi:MAG: hypothetical protein AAF410_05800 [Pseudomonadota bacterium]
MIHLFCALPCEANPLINHYGLKQLKGNQLFKLYSAEDSLISLTLTGVGKSNAAAAVAFHAASLQPLTSDIWLNIGIAGHEKAELGECFLVNKITEPNNQHAWYPQFVGRMPCPSLPLQTIDTPSKNYQTTLFDMEASGFYSIAIRIGTAELIHCIKIVSDNASQDFGSVNKNLVSQYISKHITTIDEIIAALLPHAEELMKMTAMPDSFNQMLEQIHFTATEQIQLGRVLKQWQVRLPEMNPVDHIQTNMSAKRVLQTLNKQINDQPFSLTI